MDVPSAPREIYSQEIRGPKGIEEVTGADFFFPVILPQVEEIKHISVPGFEIDGESTRALVATLVHVACGSIIRSKHWHYTIGVAIGTGDVGTKQKVREPVVVGGSNPYPVARMQ